MVKSQSVTAPQTEMEKWRNVLPSFCLHGFAPPNANRRRYDSGALGQTDDVDDVQGEDVGISVSCCCVEFFGETLELVNRRVGLDIRSNSVPFPRQHEAGPVRRLATRSDGGAFEGRRASWHRCRIASSAAILEVSQGVDGELGVANGDKIAGWAEYVGNVADASEAHLGTDLSHGIHVCLSLWQSYSKHLLSERSGSNSCPSPTVERVRGR